MTHQRRQEMLLYKHQAVIVESRIKSRIRQQLLAKVDSVIQQISASKVMKKNSCLIKLMIVLLYYSDNNLIC